ncbi:hypothetical protein [Aureibacter tunicatorum]|uniref:Mannose-6-phosphate isomerase-like protein (Cupin superfamily) n=1 Tax=Aureibacter tunicatorum TaxID=866807 RepID=A0AAE4BT32_9BACT|nr:hypothetical protein [Aureibacter tunicatorum]MDR6239545.1 mannose-6-phosphate isomerase-like protein (cupin superfamily) [Aureibacter tunicatorum]BDD04022.1 hypothetical protein AUTU_15050 [Aureibacter tunicatorum]
MKITEKYKHEGEGYSPFLIRPGWQVAQLNYEESLEIENINRLDVHFETDEAFLLMEGNALLVSAQIEEDRIAYDMQVMETGIIYNIPKNVWHTISLKENAKVLIIENDNTHKDDFEFYYFKKEQQREFLEAAMDIWP